MADGIGFILGMQLVKLPFLLGWVLLAFALDRVPLDETLEEFVLLLYFPVAGAVYIVVLIAVSWVWFLRTAR